MFTRNKPCDLLSIGFVRLSGAAWPEYGDMIPISSSPLCGGELIG